MVRNVAGSSVRPNEQGPEGTGPLHENGMVVTGNAKRNNDGMVAMGTPKHVHGVAGGLHGMGNAQGQRLEVMLGPKKTWMSREGIRRRSNRSRHEEIWKPDEGTIVAFGQI